MRRTPFKTNKSTWARVECRRWGATAVRTSHSISCAMGGCAVRRRVDRCMRTQFSAGQVMTNPSICGIVVVKTTTDVVAHALSGTAHIHSCFSVVTKASTTLICCRTNALWMDRGETPRYPCGGGEQRVLDVCSARYVFSCTHLHTPKVNDACKELLKINHYKAPRDKLICILNCCKVIFGLLLVHFSQAENAFR